MNPFVIIFVSVYTLIKEIFESSFLRDFSKNESLKIIFKIIYITLSLLSIFIIFVILLPFISFKFILKLYLKQVHKKNFGGFLNGSDSCFALQKEQIAIKTVIFVEFDNNFEDFYEKLRVSIKKTYDDVYQFRSVIKRHFGYCYLLKNQVNFDDIFSRLTLDQNKQILTLDDLLDYIDNKRLGNDKHIFETIFINQPVLLNGNKTYAIFIKVDHAVSDGFSLLSIITKHLCSSATKSFKPPNIDVSKYKKHFQLEDCYIYKNPFEMTISSEHRELMDEERNQFSAYFIESKPELINKIKNIAKKLNVTFTEVVLSGLRKGFSSFLDKKNIDFSEKFNFVITVYMDIKKMEQFLRGGYNVNDVSNSFTSTSVFFSKCEMTTSNLNVLREVSTECKKALKSIDALITTVVVDYIFSFLPTTFYDDLYKEAYKKITMVFSNLAVYGAKIVCDRKMDALLSVVTIPSNKTILTEIGCYDDRFILIMSGRYSFLESRRDVQHIMDETIKFIEDVSNEIFKEDENNENGK